uniref:Uncharacterized protein n=1 Tax=Naja naja TaxID=35670 RepID=A0A8C6VR34_NAJNA
MGEREGLMTHTRSYSHGSASSHITKLQVLSSLPILNHSKGTSTPIAHPTSIPIWPPNVHSQLLPKYAIVMPSQSICGQLFFLLSLCLYYFSDIFT